MLSERAKVVLEFITKGKDESMLRQMENGPIINSLDDFKAFMEILVVLIENSKLRETAVKLFIDRIVRDETYMLMLGSAPKKKAVIEVLKYRTIFPYVNVSIMLRRMMLEMYSNPDGLDAMRFGNLFTTGDLLDINESYLDRYLGQSSIHDSDGMNLLYSCTAANTRPKIILSKHACDNFRTKLVDDVQSRMYYLSNFFRPLYQTNSEFFPEAKLHVAEPFYLQIFDENIELFKNFLKIQSVGFREAVLKKEIFDIISTFKVPNESFDITSVKITPSLHENIRVIIA